MDFFSFLPLLSGLALFIYGMNIMGDGLNKMAGGKLERRNKGLEVLGAGVLFNLQEPPS